MPQVRVPLPNLRVVSKTSTYVFSDINCRDCGSHFSPCIASGQSILAKVYYTCKTCKHKALEAELTQLRLKHCTLCHGKIDTSMLADAAPPQVAPLRGAKTRAGKPMDLDLGK